MKKQLIEDFKNLPKTKKLSLLGLGGVILLVTLCLLIWQFIPNYAILFNQLDAKDARQIVNQLEEKNIRYKLGDDGRAILVDKDQVEKLRLSLMGANLQLSGSVGFELFDKSDFGMTDFSQKINFQRALQGELEKTIASLEEIKSARVHLVLPEKRLFEHSNTPSAAVTLHLKTGSQLKSKQVRSIQSLVAASVQNLNLKNIVIVDGQGKTLSIEDDEGFDTRFSAKKNMESYLKNKARSMLETIFPQKQININVDVTLNYDAIETSKENYLPEDNRVLTHLKETKHSKGNLKKENSNDLSVEKSYQYGRIIEKKKLSTGNIKQLSVSVVIPQQVNIEVQKQIEDVVKSAIGFNGQRGDIVSVQAIAVEKTEQESSTTILSFHGENKNNKNFLVLILVIFSSLIFLTTTAFFMIDYRRRTRLLFEINQFIESKHESD